MFCTSESLEQCVSGLWQKTAYLNVWRWSAWKTKVSIVKSLNEAQNSNWSQKVKFCTPATRTVPGGEPKVKVMNPSLLGMTHHFRDRPRRPIAPAPGAPQSVGPRAVTPIHHPRDSSACNQWSCTTVTKDRIWLQSEFVLDGAIPSAWNKENQTSC